MLKGPLQEERESKRLRRQQSNRESARRSRLRKQAESDTLTTRVGSLEAEAAALRQANCELREANQQLGKENQRLLMRLSGSQAEPVGPGCLACGL